MRMLTLSDEEIEQNRTVYPDAGGVLTPEVHALLEENDQAVTAAITWLQSIQRVAMVPGTELWSIALAGSQAKHLAGIVARIQGRYEQAYVLAGGTIKEDKKP